jgi:CubicO group peptidase (beta-lactamase class C family)
VQTIADQLEAVVASGVPGAVVAARGPGGPVEAAAGFADLRRCEALTVDHRFRVGSVTKIFVSALVLQLVAEGLLDLDGDAAPFAEGITIRQLLNHTKLTREERERTHAWNMAHPYVRLSEDIAAKVRALPETPYVGHWDVALVLRDGRVVEDVELGFAGSIVTRVAGEREFTLDPDDVVDVLDRSTRWREPR